MWQTIIYFISYANLNWKPCKSSQWFITKQVGLQRFLEMHDHTYPPVQAIKYTFAAANQKQLLTQDDEEELFSTIGNLRSFNEKLQPVKLARWLSVNDFWKHLEPELWGAKNVLESMTGDDMEAGLATLNEEETAATVGQANIRDAMLQQKGAFYQAPKFVTDSNLARMRIYAVATLPLKLDYSSRAHHIKSSDEAMTWSSDFTNGGWERSIHTIAKAVFYDPACCAYTGFATDQPEDVANRSFMLSFCTHLITERLVHLLPEVQSFPGKLHACLDPDQERRCKARQGALQEWRDLLRYESLSHHHADLKSLLNAVYWRMWTAVRLAHCMHELEHGHENGKATSALLNKLLRKIADEKHAEDIHQFLRDTGRFKRSTCVAPLRLMRTVLECDPCGQKNMRTVHIPVEDIVARARDDKLPPLAPMWRPPPAERPVEFD